MLLAGLTALFMGVGYLIGGGTGAILALIVAGAMNIFTYWNSDRMVLSMNGAQQVDASVAPDLFNMVRDLAQFINFAAFAPRVASAPLLAAGAIALLTVAVNFVVDWMLQRSSGLKE